MTRVEKNEQLDAIEKARDLLFKEYQETTDKAKKAYLQQKMDILLAKQVAIETKTESHGN